MSKNNLIFKNERTLASAGSGKTYALTNRFVALLLGGASPLEISCLTFSRKAAAEFFEKTMQKLALAAGSEAEAAKLSLQILGDSNAAGKEEFFEVLCNFVKSMPSLNMETIDSFTSKYVRYFASELGLIENIKILDEFAQKKAEDNVLSSTLNHFSESSESFKTFAETFRIANLGNEAKSVASALRKFIEDASKLYLQNSDANFWGNPKVFGLKKISQWKPELKTDLIEKLKFEKDKSEDANQLKALDTIVNFFANAEPKKIPALANNTLKSIAAQMREFGSTQNAQIAFGRSTPFTIPQDFALLCDKLIKLICEAELSLICNSVQAIYKIVEVYEKLYNENVRMKGELSFNDLPIIINDANLADLKSLVEYRFDTKFSHWLFDEFQDTSRIQWKVFENLIEEAILYGEGKKTFYCVGDIKQSIYAWRGGDPKLFEEVKEKFNLFDNAQITTSWRSNTAIIDVVNQIFSDEAGIKQHFGTVAANRWSDIWREHTVAEPNKKISGCVSFETFTKDENFSDKIYDYLKEVNPIAKGLSCAILTRKNPTAIKILEHLKKRAKEENFSLRVAGELDVKIANDNMAIPALLAFLKFSFHPSDTFAKTFVEMSPLKEFSQNENVCIDFLEKVFAFGFAEAFAEAAEILLNASSDEFTQTRINQFLVMARKFDLEEEKDADDFLHFAQTYTVREGAEKNTVQVMSIHKSKGLDFDIVILPELENVHSNLSGNLELTNSNEIITIPSKDLSAFDNNLCKIREEFADKRAYETLCTYYVALTRAKRAMHIILKEQKKTDDTLKKDFSYYLSDIFDAENSEIKILSGDKNWHKNLECAEEEISEKNSLKKQKFNVNSASQKSEKFAFEIQSENERENILFGTCAHQILEKITECNCNIYEASNALKHLYSDNISIFKSVKHALENALKNEEIFELLNHKNYWAEKTFYYLENEKIKSGRFDRINFYPQQNKTIIIDFKSSSSSENTEHFAQLKRYKNALSKLGNFEKIDLKIISIKDAKIIDLI